MEQTAKIYKCKSCKETVQKDAKKCPHCGEKNPTFTAKQGCLAYIVLSAIIGVGMYACSDDKDTTSSKAQTTQVSPQSAIDAQVESVLSQAKDYELLHSNDISHAGRSRWEAYIYAPTATTKDEQLATAAKAAMDIQKNHRVQYSWVVLFDGRSSNTRSKLVGINFAPDQKDQSGNPMGGRFKVE
ncbi:hypothetical protein AABD45_02740 [Vibrio vulnificus]|uniref:DUF4875 domain-containing protein n=1 Tax=Vibrio vulnificus TaxID=672 RepID=UPI0032480A62